MTQWKGYGPDNVLPSDAARPDNGPQLAVSAGALTYEPYYGLKAKPFSLSTDPRALYRSPLHTAVLDDLLAGIRRREGIIVLTGEMGTGKTTLCRAALYQLDRKTFTAFVPDPLLSREDLLRVLLVDFGEVSIDDLRRGRLSGASRPDLSYQLYEFLTSLESVDAFAVLVIDEAQHLAAPLLEEIRALSELEAGRRLLQIVLVGQPELQTRLKQFQMRQIEQRVTMRCELRPLSKEDVAGYVAHRLAMVGAQKERIAFASAAIDMIHAASNGVPRVVNVICDRALSHAHLERLSVIGPPIVATTLDELQLAWSRVGENGVVRPVAAERPTAPVAPESQPTPASTAQASSTVPASAVPASPSQRTGLFERRAVPVQESARATSELHALLDLPATAPRREWDATPEARIGASTAPAWAWRVESEVKRGLRTTWLKTAGLAVLGMGVVLIAGGIAVTAQRTKSSSESIAPAPSQAIAPQSVAPQTVAPTAAVALPPARGTVEGAVEDEHGAEASASAIATSASQDTWVVQVGAFSSHQRSLGLVERLMQSGFPAFEVPSPLAAGGLLYFVRVGPFKTAGEADEARVELRQFEELEGAFVRSVTTPAP